MKITKVLLCFLILILLSIWKIYTEYPVSLHCKLYRRYSVSLQDNRVHFYDVSSGGLSEVHVLNNESAAMDVKFSPDGQYVATGGADKYVRCYSVSDYKVRICLIICQYYVKKVSIHRGHFTLILGYELFSLLKTLL